MSSTRYFVVLCALVLCSAFVYGAQKPAKSRAIDNNTIVKKNVTTTTEESPKNTSSCKPRSQCFADDDCGDKGHCIGFFVGKCDCNACISFLTCEDDSACGGLQGACNTTTQLCNCINGFEANGFATILDAFDGLCNSKTCKGDNSDECFGLPCRSGRCFC